MAGPGFSAEEVESLRRKLTELNLPLTDHERELLDAVFNAAGSRVAATFGRARTTSTDVEIGNDELREMLTQILDAFTPGNNPGSVTQINIFSKIHPGGTSGGGGGSGDPGSGDPGA